jgi:sec-independent protein translocase protein TatB
MFDLDVSKIALIGAVALIVIGPEKLPKVARTVGTLVGKAQRYVSDVKSEVNRAMEMEELKKMRESFESAAKEVQTTVESTSRDFEKEFSQLNHSVGEAFTDQAIDSSSWGTTHAAAVPVYKNPGKKWRLKRSATPQWFKAQRGVRSKALSGAARVARYRPKSSIQ